MEEAAFHCRFLHASHSSGVHLSPLVASRSVSCCTVAWEKVGVDQDVEDQSHVALFADVLEEVFGVCVEGIYMGSTGFQGFRVSHV